MSTTTFGWLIILCPLVGLCIVIAAGKLPARAARAARQVDRNVLAIALFASPLPSTLISLLGHAEDSRELTSSLWNYAFTFGVDAKLEILVDPLSVYMALVVSGVSALIHIYSVAYLKSDRGYSRFFSYLNFFVFSMLLLVLAGNFLVLIVGWAFVGAASYLLISFWYRRTTRHRRRPEGLRDQHARRSWGSCSARSSSSATLAAGRLQFKVFAAWFRTSSRHNPRLRAGCACSPLLLLGAFAKSAQVPLHTWLPDAMEGPTPVSSLIMPHGHRQRRLPDRAHTCPRCSSRRPRLTWPRSSCATADRGHDRDRADRPQTR